MTARSLTGPHVLEELGDGLDELHAASDAPITARRPWLQTWIECFPDHEPWAIVIEDGSRLEGAALLARRRSRGVTRVVALGHGPSDQARMPARDAGSAAELARNLAQRLQEQGGPWTLRLEQLPLGDPFAHELAARLPTSAVVPGDGSPTLFFDRGRSFETYVSKRSRGVARTMMNRIKKAGHGLSIGALLEPAEIARLLPLVEEIHRERDAALLRRSDLEDEKTARFWRSVVLRLAERGEVQLTTAFIDKELVAYEIGLLDKNAYRMWDGRFRPAWGWFSPGRLTGLAALGSALKEERFQEFDWMRGLEEYKMRLAGNVVPAEHLLAWSSPVVRTLIETPGRALDSLRRVKERSPRLDRAWRGVKRRTILRGTDPGR